MAEENKKTAGRRLAKYVPDYIAFDLETTGISYVNDKIIEISAVKAIKGKVTDTFSTLVNPQCTIPHEASRVNGITDAMVAKAPLIEEVLPDFLTFIGDFVLVGHNIQYFDLRFINQAAQQLSMEPIANDFIDTLAMARSCLPQLFSHKLSDVSAYLGIDTAGAHRALNDCMMALQCYEKMAEIQKGMVLELCPQCGGELKKRKGKFGEFFGCSNYPQCRFTKKCR